MKQTLSDAHIHECFSLVPAFVTILIKLNANDSIYYNKVQRQSLSCSIYGFVFDISMLCSSEKRESLSKHPRSEQKLQTTCNRKVSATIYFPALCRLTAQTSASNYPFNKQKFTTTDRYFLSIKFFSAQIFRLIH